MATLMLHACPHVQTGFDLSLLEHSAPLLPALPTSLGSLLLGSVGDGVVFKEPFLCGRGHSCELAVKHGLFILGHDEVLWGDHCLRKALVCNGRDHRRVRGTAGSLVSPHQCSGKSSKKSWVRPASLKEADTPAQLELRTQSPGPHVGAALGKTPLAPSKALSTLVPSKQIKAVTGLQISLASSKYPSNVNNSCPPWVLPPKANRASTHTAMILAKPEAPTASRVLHYKRRQPKSAPERQRGKLTPADRAGFQPGQDLSGLSLARGFAQRKVPLA